MMTVNYDLRRSKLARSRPDALRIGTKKCTAGPGLLTFLNDF